MAKVEISKMVMVRLILSEDEAIWLKGLCQNYLGSGKESQKEHSIRSSIWGSLHIQGIGRE